MATCTSCGYDVTGKKFCPECGIPVQAAAATGGQDALTSTCPRCNGTVKPNAAFCMHCGTSLAAHALAATATPTVVSQPLTHTCAACHTEVPVGNAFCTNCGQSMQASATPMTSSAPGTGICTSCGRQNNPGVNFCAGCGHPISASTATPQTNYGQSGPYPQQPQYPQAQYQQYPQNPQQYQQYPPTICATTTVWSAVSCAIWSAWLSTGSYAWTTTDGFALPNMHGHVTTGDDKLSQLPCQPGGYCPYTCQCSNARPARRTGRFHARQRRQIRHGSAWRSGGSARRRNVASRH